jgi:hypothetical protein
VLTGELREKSASTKQVDRNDSFACTLRLGYCLVKGQAPTKDWDLHQANHATVRMTSVGGKITDVSILHPFKSDTFTAKVAKSALAIDGDRLTGSVKFDLKSDAVEPGAYAFTFEAIIDADQLNGFWRGTHNGRDILTKSAKLGGSISGMP